MLHVYGLEQSDIWDSIVKTFLHYDVYWLSGYVKAFAIHGDGIPLLFYYEDEEVRGIHVVMKRDIADDVHFTNRIPVNTYWDFASPYGYGGWLIEGTHKERLFETYQKWCIEQGIISEFVRFHPIIRNHASCVDYYDVIPLGNTIAMRLDSPELIWDNIHSKNRNMIRKAEKNGVEIQCGNSQELFQAFRMIYDATMDKDHAEKYYYFKDEFYESIRNDLAQNALLFYAMYEKKIIAASIFIFANGYMNYHLSGSVREYAHLAPTNKLLYEAALWGCAHGYHTLYLGGGVGSGEDGLYKFKKSFYRPEQDNRFYIGKKVYCMEKYEELLRLREDVSGNFFPRYRA